MKYLSSSEIKHIELELLIKLREYCKEHNIYYTLAGGTLLGAIRHKGFIPWDDDIDVMLPRAEYNRLLDLLSKEPIAKEVSLLKPGDEGYFYPFAKLYDNRTVAKMEDNTSEHGIWIDIFPLDDLPENNSKLKKLFKKTRFWRATIISMTTDLPYCGHGVKAISKKFLHFFANVVGKEKIVSISSRVAQSYNETGSNYIGGALWGYGSGERMSKIQYMQSEQVEFEGELFNAQSCWDAYLTGLYGNYMQLPKEEDRINHCLKAWYKDEF